MANALVRCGYFALAATARRSVLLLGLLVACLYAAPAGAQAIISNGGIALGVDSLGQLNVPDGTGGPGPLDDKGNLIGETNPSQTCTYGGCGWRRDLDGSIKLFSKSPCPD